MNWKEQLKKLELLKQWDIAIEFMQHVLENSPNNIDAYLSIDYLLMNLLVEEQHDESKHDYYENLLKQYFNQSYAKFSNSAEYLYYTGRTALISEWYMGLDTEEAEAMIEKARLLEPNNLIYNMDHYRSLDFNDPKQLDEAYDYAKMVLEENSPIKTELMKKGSLGEYIYRMMLHWNQDVINLAHQNEKQIK